ncbi:MAG: 23S rRNA (pseudouridine(1915)-N(3))-methyltransferase RlmH [Bdellovibrionota bacterium]
MKIVIAAVYKRLNPHEQAWIDEYLTRLRSFVSVEWFHIKESGSDQSSSKEKIWTQLQKRITPETHICLLDEKGTHMSSMDLHNYIEKRELHACKQLLFVLGGAYGHPEQIQSLAHQKLSLSKATLAHRIAMLVLSEQLYRAYSIKHNLPYHHD